MRVAKHGRHRPPSSRKSVEQIVEDPAQSAKLAGLRYVTDAKPGIRRLRHGKSFRYVDAEGRAVRDRETLARIKSLVIPPAWNDVWICPIANGHLQATGRDARGRKQSRYHPRWREVRDETKYERLALFGSALPKEYPSTRRGRSVEPGCAEGEDSGYDRSSHGDYVYPCW